ncbi:MAG: RidA family protein [Muribaculaceae bacterium]|nr:RidA family protein [Muribaculaceae bacterium]
MKTAMNTAAAPAAIGPYSQGIAATGTTYYLSGQLPIDPATGAFPEGGIQEQTRQSLLNAQAILKSVGLDLNNVVKTTVLLSDIANFGPMNEVYAEFFAQPFPARSAFAVRDLPKGALVEIEMVAVGE